MEFRATTILAVKKDNQVSLAGDGQVTLGSTVVKSTAKKIRKMYNDKIIAGFAGAAADAFTLFDKFENKLDEHAGNLKKSAVELAKEWRSDRGINLDAMLLVADEDTLLIISGNGDVLEPDDDMAAIGSGGSFAYAAAKALYVHSDLSAEEIAVEGLKIAGDICIYTNTNITVETINKTKK